jgi:hypothetical protein
MRMAEQKEAGEKRSSTREKERERTMCLFGGGF